MRKKWKILATVWMMALAVSCMGLAGLAAAAETRTESIEGYQIILKAAAAEGAMVDGTLIKYGVKHGDASTGDPTAFTVTNAPSADVGSLGDPSSTTAAYASWGDGGKWQMFSAKNDGILFEIEAKENLSLKIEKTSNDFGWLEGGKLSLFGKDAEGTVYLLKEVAFTSANEKDKSLYGGTFNMLAGETLYYQFRFEWDGRQMQGPPVFTATATDGTAGGVGNLDYFKEIVQTRFDEFAATLAEADYDTAGWAEVTALIDGFPAALEACTTMGAIDELYSAQVEAVNAVRPKLSVYKTRQEAQLTAYIDTLGRDNYDADGITALEAEVTAFTAAVADAADYDAVDTAFAASKAAMDGVKVKLSLYAANLKAALDTRVSRLEGSCTFDAAGTEALDAAVAAYSAAMDGFADYAAADTAYDTAVAAIEAVVPATEKAKLSDTVTAVINNDFLPVDYSLITWGFYYGSLDDQRLFTVHTGDGTGSADDALTQGQTAVKRWQLEADPECDVIMKLTARQDIALSFTHRKTDFPDGLVWSTHTGLRFVTEDAEGTRFTVKETMLATTMPENFYSMTVHLKAGETFYIDYFALNAWGSIDFEPNFTASTADYDASKRPDYAVLKALEEEKTAKCALLEEYVAGLDENDYSLNNWSSLQSLLTEGKAAIMAAQDAETLAAAYEAADASLKGVESIAQQEASLAAYKTQKLDELKAHVGALDRATYTDAEWAEVEKAVSDFEAALDGYTTKTKVDVGFAAAVARVDGVTPTVEPKGCGCGGLVGTSAGLALAVCLLIGAVLLVGRRKKTEKN